MVFLDARARPSPRVARCHPMGRDGGDRHAPTTGILLVNAAEKQAWVTIPVAILVGAGVAWAGSQGTTADGVPVFAICCVMAFAVNWIAFVPAYLGRTERFYDLTGSITYLGTVALALALSGATDLRAILLGALVAVWAVRLGSFLFARIRREGGDARFESIKVSFPRFLMAWTLQGLWVLITLACALAAITSAAAPPLGGFAIVGAAVWVFGFSIEVIADRQKSRFRSDPANRRRFIQTGLWARSRHPNYFGEITLWVGIALIALPELRGWQHVTLVSPVFVYLLLTRVSGIPILEERAEARWGDDPAYRAYRDRTPSLLPRAWGQHFRSTRFRTL